MEIGLKKSIPAAAGLGGGSADAAAVLVGLNHWFDNVLPVDKLLEIGASLGADVPFCIIGGTALAEGFGERLTPLSPLPDCHIVLVKAGEKASTQRMYALYDQYGGEKTAFTDGMKRAISAGDLAGIAGALGNAFDGLANRETADQAKRILKETGALGTGLSGSGPTIYGIYDRTQAADAGAHALAAAGMAPIRCRPAGFGCSVESSCP